MLLRYRLEELEETLVPVFVTISNMLLRLTKVQNVRRCR